MQLHPLVAHNKSPQHFWRYAKVPILPGQNSATPPDRLRITSASLCVSGIATIDKFALVVCLSKHCKYTKIETYNKNNMHTKTFPLN